MTTSTKSSALSVCCNATTYIEDEYNPERDIEEPKRYCSKCQEKTCTNAEAERWF